MKIYKTTMHDLIQQLDDSFVEEIYFQSEPSIPSSSKIKKRVKNSLAHTSAPFFLRKKVVFALAGILVFLPLTIYGVPQFIQQSAIIDESNEHLIGKETISNNYIIYSNGIYRDQNGEIVDITKVPDALAENRIISSIEVGEDSSFSPSSIVEIPLETGSEKNWSIPELLLVNASVCVFTQENGDGWSLSSESEIQITFDKYPSEAVRHQTLLIGYIHDGTMYSWDSFEKTSGTYSLTIPQDGTYYFYVMSASSDYLALKESTLSIR